MALGMLIGDVFVTFFGTGVWQIILVCLLAMSVATLIGAGNLEEAVKEGLAVVRYSPFRRGQLPAVQRTPTSTVPWTGPVAICGCWLGGARCRCGAARRYRCRTWW